jgi:hypothetical protein
MIQGRLVYSWQGEQYEDRVVSIQTILSGFSFYGNLRRFLFFEGEKLGDLSFI